jgi:hypothetical protein
MAKRWDKDTKQPKGFWVMARTHAVRYAEAWQGECDDGLILVHLYPVKEANFHETWNGPAGCRCEPTIDFMMNKYGQKAFRIARHQVVLNHV